jgi:hypothetical protein
VTDQTEEGERRRRYGADLELFVGEPVAFPQLGLAMVVQPGVEHLPFLGDVRGIETRSRRLLVIH